MRIAAAVVSIGLAVIAGFAVPVADAHPSEPGVVSYAVLGKGSVGNIVGAPMGWEAVFTRPFQAFWVELPACNNWVDIGLPEVYDDPDLASFNGATTQTSATDQTHLVKQAVGVFASNDAADRAFHRVVDRTVGCSGQTTAIHLDDGTTGAAMMTSTAAIQVNLDAGPQEGWAERVRLAHALGPTMIAIAANSPMLGGRFSGWQSTRQRVWGQMDSARCGPILGASGDHPGIDWAKYALKAPVMMVRSPDTQDTRAVTDYVPFTDWVDGRVLLDGRRATVADLVYHLTTLFPPVRPRQWLEIRYLDSVPDEVWPAVVFTLVTLLDDPVAADLAVDAVEPVATAWDTAARIGLADRRLYLAANRCLAIAARRVPTELIGAMQRLVDHVDRGVCPADDFSDRVIAGGIASAVTGMMHGAS